MLLANFDEAVVTHSTTPLKFGETDERFVTQMNALQKVLSSWQALCSKGGLDIVPNSIGHLLDGFFDAVYFL